MTDDEIERLRTGLNTIADKANKITAENSTQHDQLVALAMMAHALATERAWLKGMDDD